MDHSTPSKQRGLLPVGDDTAISTPPAPWDPADGDPDEEDTGSEPARITAPTQTIVPADYDLAPGAKLGEYQIEQRIGQGGMGVVFSAVHPLIGKRAAIKILKKELCADQHTVERFIDEARVVNQIGHPNIVDIFAFGEMPDGRSYFVMEWLKGTTLRERIASGPVTIAETCRLTKQLARALQAAHEKGIIHRDLKPDNVFLVDQRDELPAIKLLDFGIAKLAHTDHRVERTATGAIVGTPQYIAPEQAKGYAIDARADIYALGGIVFELLCGRPPFVADNAMEMVAKHLMEPPVRVATLNREVPGELDALVDAMLAKTPDGRPSLERIMEVLDRVRDRASAPALLGVRDSAPAIAPVVQTLTPGASRDLSHAVSAPMPSMRSGPPWALIGGAVVVAGIIAFVIVRFAGGGDEPAAHPPAPAAAIAPAPVVTSPATPAPRVVAPAAGATTDASSGPPPVVASPPPPTPAVSTQLPPRIAPPKPPKQPKQPPELAKVPGPKKPPATAPPKTVTRPKQPAGPDDDHELMTPGSLKK